MARFFEYLAVDALDPSYHVWNNFMSEVFVQAMLVSPDAVVAPTLLYACSPPFGFKPSRPIIEVESNRRRRCPSSFSVPKPGRNHEYAELALASCDCGRSSRFDFIAFWGEWARPFF